MKTKALTEGAVLASLYAVLLLITLYLPILSTITLFLLSLPFTIYTIRHGIKKSLLFVLTAIVLSVILGSLASIFMPILFGSVGVILGYIYREQKNAFALLLGATLTYLVNFVLIYVISILFLDLNLGEMARESIKQAISMTEQFGEILGGDVEQGVEQLQGVLKIIPYLIPTAMVMGAVTLGFISIFITTLFLKKLRITVPKWVPFREWSFPRSVIWYYLGTLLLLFTNPELGSGMYIVTYNLYFILEVVLTIQGLACIYYYFWIKKRGKTIPVFITIGVFLIPVGFYIVRILGIIDLGFDLRKKIKA